MMEFQTYDINEAKPGESWILLYYGGSGSGKTWFAGTAGERTFFINIGDGIETLKSPGFRSRYKAPSMAIDLNEKLDLKDEQVLSQGFDLTCQMIDFAFNKRLADWDQLVIDDITALRRMALNKAIKLNNAQRQAQRSDRDETYVKIEVGDYGVEMDMINWFLGTYIPMFKGAKKHLVMTAHERHIFGKPAKIGEPPPLIAVKPAFTGRTFPDDAIGFFDDVFRAECVGGMGNKVWRCHTVGNEIYAGKPRHNGIFNDVEVNPQYPLLLNRIKEGKLIPKYTGR